jgi:phospholipid/cholesterol/gamma-HCH transport system substrate-binding protein
MISTRAVGAGAFVIIGLLLFACGLFLIGDRRMLFERRFALYTEFSQLGELEVGSDVRVAGANAGEVADIEPPTSPSGKFRVRMLVREALHPIIRTDSVAGVLTEGLVGGVYINIAGGTDQAARVPVGGIIPGREQVHISDLVRQATETVTMVNQTVASLRGDVEMTVKQVSLTAEDAHRLIETVRPEIEAIAKNGSRISADTSTIVSNISQGKGTFGKLVNDDQLYDRFLGIADQAQGIMANLRGASDEAHRAVIDFRAKDGPAQGLLTDMRTTLGQAREATADLADNLEAMKHNFLLRGYFNRRGYYDLDAISPAEYRGGVLENGKRRAMRIWLKSTVLLASGPDGAELLTSDGRHRIDSAMATYLEYLPSNPVVIEGYASGTTAAERFRLSRNRAALVREYLIEKYHLTPQSAGFIGLGDQAPGSPDHNRWDGVSLTLFLDKAELQFANRATP